MFTKLYFHNKKERVKPALIEIIFQEVVELKNFVVKPFVLDFDSSTRWKTITYDVTFILIR